MTRADIPRWFARWWPILAVAGAALLMGGALKSDVDNSVRVPRFEQESIRVNRDIRDLQRTQDRIDERLEKIDDICRAVRCASR